MKDRQNSGKPQNSCCFECIWVPFCSAYSPEGSLTRPRLHNLLSGISNIIIERPKITSFVARSSHKQKVRTFFPFAIGIFSRKTAFKHCFGDFLCLECKVWWQKLICYILPSVSSKFRRHEWSIGEAVSEIFIFVFYTVLRVVRKGVSRGSPWTGPYVVHGPGL